VTKIFGERAPAIRQPVDARRSRPDEEGPGRNVLSPEPVEQLSAIGMRWT